MKVNGYRVFLEGRQVCTVWYEGYTSESVRLDLMRKGYPVSVKVTRINDKHAKVRVAAK